MKAVVVVLIGSIVATNSAHAADLTMICKNPRREYVVRFNEQKRVLIAKAEEGDTRYQVLSVESSPSRLWVTGLTVNNGPSFRASFRPKKTMEYFSDNKLLQTDPCR